MVLKHRPVAVDEVVAQQYNRLPAPVDKLNDVLHDESTKFELSEIHC